MFSKRAKEIFWVCMCVLFLLSLRLFNISMQKGKTYEAMAQRQQKKVMSVGKIRGSITDRTGISFTDRDTETVYISADSKISYNTDDCRENVFEFDIKKRAPSLATHLIGYTTPDGQGLSGIELLYDNILNTGTRTLTYMADAGGIPVDSFEINENNENKKTSIKLTLDYYIQEIAEKVMDKYIKNGAAVILDTNTFDVVAMVSRPGFDSKNIQKYEISSNGELLNRAIMPYNAGSIFKIVTASAALEKNPAFIERQFDCRGMFNINDNHTFLCHKEDGHGLVSFDEAFAFSCNCSFYVTALEAGADLVMDMAQNFGMGQKLLSVNVGEDSGNIPKREVYSDAETLNISIGQGEILVTPLQCAALAATVANSGIRKSINIVDTVEEKGNEICVRQTGEMRVISEQTAFLIGKMMRDCVLYGTGDAAAKSSIAIAGKTGSAETGWIKNSQTLVHGWFCGFFPYENPKYAMAILSEGGKSGAGSCVVPFKEIAEEINRIYPFCE